MLHSLFEQSINQRSIAHQKTQPFHFDYGELTQYDPTTHTGKFHLSALETGGPNTDNPMETPFIQIGSTFAGGGYGAQFPPALGSQALIVFIGGVPLAAIFLFNDYDTVPFPAGDAWGWKDAHGNTIVTSSSGVTVTDYHGNTIVTSSSGVTVTSPTTVTIVAPTVGLGASFSDLPSQSAIPRQSDVQTTVDAERASRQQDMENMVAAIQAASYSDHFSSLVAPTAVVTTPVVGSPTTRST